MQEAGTGRTLSLCHPGEGQFAAESAH